MPQPEFSDEELVLLLDFSWRSGGVTSDRLKR
jgi:hypothetical protein